MRLLWCPIFWSRLWGLWLTLKAVGSLNWPPNAGKLWDLWTVTRFCLHIFSNCSLWRTGNSRRILFIMQMFTDSKSMMPETSRVKKMYMIESAYGCYLSNDWLLRSKSKSLRTYRVKNDTNNQVNSSWWETWNTGVGIYFKVNSQR